MAASSAAVRWGWRGLSPELREIRLVQPRLRVKIDTGGRVSLGQIEHLFQGGGAAGGGRPALPRLRLDVEDGQALIEAPFGAITASFHAAGLLGRDFTALADIAPSTRSNGPYALRNGRGTLQLASAGDELTARFDLTADALHWDSAHYDGVALHGAGGATLDLSTVQAQAALTLAQAETPQLTGAQLNIALNANAAMKANALTPQTWRGEARATAARFAYAGNSFNHADVGAHIDGGDAQGRGAWRFVAQRFAGLSMISDAPSAQGELSYDLSGDETLRVSAQVALARTQLDAEAQRMLRTALPELGGAPIGPTFAQARHALDAAADRFDLTAQAGAIVDENGLRVLVEQPVEARAATGTQLRIARLRDDLPAIVFQTKPAASLAGRIALDLAGGGAPNLQILFDQVNWQAGQPLEAEGTLSITNWQAQNASIAAQDLTLRLSLPPQGEGRLDLVGAARITGPVGDGLVRNLAPDLNLAVQFGDGWRVIPNQGCLPVRLDGLDVAGLSFAAGAFQLCPTGGVLAAADANNALRGGFTIQGLQLAGRMAGPDGQPARLRAASVRADLGGSTDAAQVRVLAAAPTLAIDIDRARTIEVQGRSLTANAAIGNGSWRVDGAFDAGALNDPSMPGAISAIAGRWNAAPDEDGAVVVRVEAGQAYVNAREAPADAQDRRPLFNPIRLSDIEAVMRNGRINAEGRILLDHDGHMLARFTAEHNSESGEGAAHIIADDITFDPRFQPYLISELARGLVDNVRGPASGAADIVWDRHEMRASGVARPNGVSLSMATIPDIKDVRGEVHFDNLFDLTTPPGQTLSIGELNPGVAVHNGIVSFQLLSDQRVAIESAQFEFAQGVLGLAPTTIRLGAEETRFNLTLRDVDVAALIDQLNMPDLRATGRVEGTFPMLLTSRTAFIENGELHAAPGGGTISYVGNAGDGMTGAPRVAFDALRSFRYDALRLTLNGDLSDEIVTSISFSGQNTGQPVDLNAISSTPVRVNARGVPFAFNVTLTAPFRALARTAAGVINPSDLLGTALENDRNRVEEGGGGAPDGENNANRAPASVDVQVAPLR